MECKKYSQIYKKNFFYIIYGKIQENRRFQNLRFFLIYEIVFLLILKISQQGVFKMKSFVKAMLATVAGLAVFTWYQNRK